MKLLSVLVLLLSVNSAQASEQELRRFFSEVESLQADFDQSVTDESGMLLDTSSGIFSLSRPGKFRWNYASKDPYAKNGQQIVSDGNYITFYDPDLETANQRPFLQALKRVPTLALVQSGEEVDRYFEITDFGLTDGLTWVVLKPKDEDAAYRDLMVGFKQSILSSIVLTDGLGNETRLNLRNLKANALLDESLFEFVAKDGIDVVRE